MLIALAFAHFSSELLLKEQMIIPVKKTLNNAGHIDAKLIDFSKICQKNPAKSADFYWLFLGKVSPPPEISRETGRIFWEFAPENPSKFDFFPLKSRKIGRFLSEFQLFSRENPPKSADFSANLPLNIPQNFAFFSAKYQKPWLYAGHHGFPQFIQLLDSLHSCASRSQLGRAVRALDL